MAIDTSTQIEEALAEADIQMDAARFVDVLRQALHGMRHRRAPIVPSTQLTESEVAELRAGGLAPTADMRSYELVRARTAIDLATLLATALTTGQAAERLGVDASRIRQLLAEGRLLATKAAGEWRILELQFAGTHLVPGIDRVVSALPAELPLLAAANWLTSPEPDLEIGDQPVSPLEWLAAGGESGRLRQLAADL